MKKLLAIVLLLVLVLSLSAVAFADGSPVKEVTPGDLPGESDAVKKATVANKWGDAKIVAIKDMNEAQKEALDKALEKLTEKNKTEAEKAMPVDAFAVESIDAATVTIELEESAVVYIFYSDGTIVKLYVKDLTKAPDGRYLIPGCYLIPVDCSCTIIIAKPV